MLLDGGRKRKMQHGKNFKNQNERGAALAMAVIIIAILAVIGMTALAFSSTEVRTASGDLQRTQAFYASAAALEKMTSDFSDLFRKKLKPLEDDLNTIEKNAPDALKKEGFDFTQTLEEDAKKLAEMRSIQGLANTVYPRVNISEGPFAGLYASIIPYKMSSVATNKYTKAQVKLEREFNNYLVPIFQFGVFSNEDIEVHPGPLMTFNGRMHSNANIYALRNTIFQNKLTMAGELVRDATRGGETNNSSGWDNVSMMVGNTSVKMTRGSVEDGSGTVGGPNLKNSTSTSRGYFPGSPDGVANSSWETESVRSADGNPNRFGGQVYTRTTGATKLNMPLELEGNSPAEIIKRALPSDSEILSGSRYHNKAKVRILIDDENAGSGSNNAAGIEDTKGVKLSAFTPLEIGGGNVLRRVSDAGAYLDDPVKQITPDGKLADAKTARGIRKASNQKTPSGNYVPPGADIKGKILIEIVKPDGTTVDVTQQILSMGMTEGEPNGIVYLQRPLWAAFVQGSRDRNGNNFDLVNLTRNGTEAVDGEIIDPLSSASFFNSDGFITIPSDGLSDDEKKADSSGPGSGTIIGGIVKEVSKLLKCIDKGNGKKKCEVGRDPEPDGTYNQIVPINVYNVREGWYQSQMDEYRIYERGITSVIEINMRNLVRWLDGVYDNNLLNGTNAVSSNIDGAEGYVVYISDRRGDGVKAEYLANGTAYNSTNGTVDNEDIYGPNGKLDDGEDVIDFGWDATQSGKTKKDTLQKDIKELPDYGKIWAAVSGDRYPRALEVMTWTDLSTKTSGSYFRRGVRLFDGENLTTTGAVGKLSSTKGITIASENMVYIWGNYNTTGITSLPATGSTLNDGGFTGPQVAASIACDAFFPLSKTWFDGLSALYPEGSSNARGLSGTAYRMADDNLPDVTQSTSVRAGIIAGTTTSVLTATPGRDAAGIKRSGGVINFPRFLEIWNLTGVTQTWNYAGSFVPLYRSTQALSQWENSTAIIYMPPRRNWSFDQTFLNSAQLPPGTPFFQYTQATGFRQRLKD